jgi:hypothetical protein
MDPQLLDQLKQTIWVASRVSADSYGKWTYGTAAERAARVIGRSSLVRDATGREVVSMVQLILESPISLTDKLWLPGEDATTDPGHVPVAVATRVDENGNTDHAKVWLGSISGGQGT